MKSVVNREIPGEFLKDGREVYQGECYMDGKYIKRDSPRTRRYVELQSNKLYSSIRKACKCCSAHDGMTVSFHSEFREGDYVTSMVAKVLVEETGLKDTTIVVTSPGNVQGPIADYIGQGRVTGIQTSGVRGRIDEMTSAGKLMTPAIIRSHGRRPRMVEVGEVHIDIVFLVTFASDCWGSAKRVGGKNNCDSVGSTIHDSRCVDYTVIITDTLVDFPNRPSFISAENVDCVCVVGSIGDATKITTKEARAMENPRELMMTEHVAKVIVTTSHFTDSSSFQTGAGGLSLAISRFIEKHMIERKIKVSFALGGVTSAVYQLLDKGLVRAILDTQDFDMGAIEHLAKHPKHHEISMSKYANPVDKGAYVNQLDSVALSALKTDVNFNVNVITGSSGILHGAPGGHPGIAAGGKCHITITPLTRGHTTAVCDEVITATIPGDCVDILVTDYSIAIDPLCSDLAQCLDAAGIRYVTIEWLRDRAYSLVGAPDALEWEDQVVAVVEVRDGTLLDTVRKIGPLRLDG